MKKGFTVGLLVSLFFFGCGKDIPPPNVVLITIDTLRADHVGCYGYYRNTTPNLDRFAKGSIVFTNAFAPMPTTLPSHSSIMTSLYPFEHEVRANGWELHADRITLAEILRENGYATTAFVSVWGIGKQQGMSQGFDLLEESQDFGRGTNESERLSEYTTAHAIEWLQKREIERAPFFLWVHYFDPHTDYNPPEPYRSMFPSSSRTKGVDGTTDSIREILNGRIHPLPEDVEHMRNLYDGEIRYMDANLGKLLNLLGRSENMLTVIVADHGESFGEHDSWEHGRRLYDFNIRVPFILRPPGDSRNGKIIDVQAELVDVMPTILDYISIPAPPDLSGRSLKDMDSQHTLSNGKGFLERLYISEEYSKKYNIKPEPLVGVRRWPWKFLLSGSGNYELYDLSVDPAELHDLSAERPDIVESFRTEVSDNLRRSQKVAIPGMNEETREKLKALGYL